MMTERIRNLIICIIAIYKCSVLLAQETEITDDNSKNGYIVVDGSTLNYTIEGIGKPCLVIGSSVYYPKTFSRELHNYLKMYFVDMKWFARDYKPEKLDSVTIQSVVEDVEEIRTKLELKDPV